MGGRLGGCEWAVGARFPGCDEITPAALRGLNAPKEQWAAKEQWVVTSRIKSAFIRVHLRFDLLSDRRAAGSFVTVAGGD